MSCPNWNRLSSASDNPEIELTEAVRDHAARCSACYPRAVRLDPTVAFRRLPEVTVSADDIESMKQAVSALRRGRSVGSEMVEIGRAPEPVAQRPTLRTIRLPASTTLLRAAAVATIVIGASVGIWSSLGPLASPNTQPVAAIAEQVSSPRLPATTIGADPALRDAATAPVSFVRGPLIENVEGFTVIQMAYDDLDLVVLDQESTQEVSALDV